MLQTNNNEKSSACSSSTQLRARTRTHSLTDQCAVQNTEETILSFFFVCFMIDSKSRKEEKRQTAGRVTNKQTKTVQFCKR